jgi:hypothetical protein
MSAIEGGSEPHDFRVTKDRTDLVQIGDMKMPQKQPLTFCDHHNASRRFVVQRFAPFRARGFPCSPAAVDAKRSTSFSERFFESSKTSRAAAISSNMIFNRNC